MKSSIFFITGTDTGVGKTWVSCRLLQYWQQQGLKTVAMKPVASGCHSVQGVLYNDDALALQEAMSCQLDYHSVNPLALEAAIAPHIAAQKEGLEISPQHLVQHCRRVLQETVYDVALIEGAGGWRVPLADQQTWKAVVQPLKIPVILVVDMRLGCINHALLSSQAIVQDGITLAGWIANSAADSMLAYADNLHTLQELMPAPLLACIAFSKQNVVPLTATDMSLTSAFYALF